MIVVLPVWKGDEELALQTLNWARKLDGSKVPFDCVVSYPSSFNPGRVVSSAREYFRGVAQCRYGETAQNHALYAWSQAASFVYRTTREPWLWFEPDTIPLRPGWLTTLSEAYTLGLKPVLGLIVHQHVAKTAVYPADVCVGFLRPTLGMADAFNAILNGEVVRRTFNSTLVQAVSNTHFESKGDLARLCSNAVLFHSCKDGSLISLLSKHPLKKLNLPDNSPRPTILRQTNFETGLFEFSDYSISKDATKQLRNATTYFNPSIIEHDGRTVLLARRFQFWNRKGYRDGGDFRNDVSAWEIGRDKTLSLIGRPISTRQDSTEQWEDPRAFTFQDDTYVSCAYWDFRERLPIQQRTFRIKKDFSSSEDVGLVPYGGNTATRFDKSLHEKNWTWFVQDGQVHMIYRICPHTVIRLLDWKPTDTLLGNDWSALWKYGDPRGGSNPVRVGNEWFGFFHSSTPWPIKGMRYFMGAYCFSAAPPFRVTYATTSPILVGSSEDPGMITGKNVVFPGGAVLKDDVWTVVLGVNDENCAWIEIPHDELLKRMTFVRLSFTNRIKRMVGQ